MSNVTPLLQRLNRILSVFSGEHAAVVISECVLRDLDVHKLLEQKSSLNLMRCLNMLKITLQPPLFG